MAECSTAQQDLADVVKQVHSKLRKDFRSGQSSASQQWSSHVADTELLTSYSKAMHALAVGPWATKQEGDRIQWCVDKCEEYFKSDLNKLLLKDLRRLTHAMPTLVPSELLPESEDEVDKVVQEFNSQRWSLLDVGSCYNPFAVFPQFNVTAIDIGPACESVQKCDFLTTPITPHPSSNSELRANSFDIVVFSLLLSYMPSPEQRLQCCVQAHKSLRLHGVLLIITPDSSHQNRHAHLMKTWKETIEAVGFHRWKYEKCTHLHCLGFRKVCAAVRSVEGGLQIPQDRDELEQSWEPVQADVESFCELPFNTKDT